VLSFSAISPVPLPTLFIMILPGTADACLTLSILLEVFIGLPSTAG
jgi:hypothetical protein